MNQVLQILTKLRSDNEITQIKLAGHISNITRSVQFNHEEIQANDAINDNLREDIKRMQNEIQKYENRMGGMQADVNQAKKELS